MNDFPALDAIDLNEETYPVSPHTFKDVVWEGIDILVTNCHAASYNRGWWHDPITGLSLIPSSVSPDYATPSQAGEIIKAWFPYVIATKIALIHSETSEGLEAYRVDARDDKIPDFAGITAEMADVVIRVCDLMGCLQRAAAEGIIIDLGPDAYRLSGAILAKMPFNAGRPDHALANRAKPGGKKF